MKIEIPKLLTIALPCIVFLGLLSGCTKREEAAIQPKETGMILAKKGEAQCVIVAAQAEKVAAGELKTHLDNITGGNFTIVEEEAFAGDKPAIYLGETEFAKKHGIDFSAFTPEEWLLKTVDGNLIIGGSKMNGSLFGVYDLLENQLGCHWFSPEVTHIPKNPDASLAELDIRKMPSFADRIIFSSPDIQSIYPWTLVNKETRAAFERFEQRSRSHRFTGGPIGERGVNQRAHGGPLAISSQYSHCHNFYSFVSPQKYFKSNPEYFSMNKKGERTSTHESQLCLSNPDVWEVTLDSLRGFIKKDRETLPPDQWPTVYDISQNDSQEWGFICKCPECLKITEREGSESGLILTYINHVAREIAKEYPEIKIRTFAYLITEKPPKTLRPEPNVIIRWCDLFIRSDCYRPLTSSFNAKQKAQLEAWSSIGANIAVWDYWNLDLQEDLYFRPARVETMVDAIAPDLRYFKEAGVVSYFTQINTFPSANPQNFADLQVWLGYQLLLDLNRDPEPLISLYMDKVYGPAAEPMTKFLNALREAIRTEKAPLFYPWNSGRPNTRNKAFLTQAYQWLTEARNLTEPGSDYRRRVEKEMITPLSVILRNPQFQIPGRDAMLALYTELRNGRIERYYPSGAQGKLGDVQSKLKEGLARDLIDFEIVDIPPPPQFSHVPESDIRKFAYPIFFDAKGTKTLLVDDPDSAVRKAMTAPPSHPHGKTSGNGKLTTPFGVYEHLTKKQINFEIPAIPDDEKYHWFKVGVFDITPITFVYGFSNAVKAHISHAYADGPVGSNKWEVWVSVKYTGPAYVPGSTKPNQIFWDQVVLVRPGSVRE